MPEIGVTGQEHTVIQDHRAIPVIHIQKDNMLISRLQYHNPVPCILRLNGRFSCHLSSYSFSQQIADSFDPRGGLNISYHPLHSSGLNRHIRLAEIAHNLALPYIHSITEISRHSIGRSYTEIPGVFYHSKRSHRIQYIDIVVIGKITDVEHC